MLIAGQDETIIEQKSGIALMTVWIEYLQTSRDVFQRLDHEASVVIVVEPAGLLGQAVVEHVGDGDEGICFVLLDYDPEDPGAHC